MRSVLLLLALAGCEVVFPLRDEGLGRPTVSNVTAAAPVIAGDEVMLVIDVTGVPATPVAYQIELDQGMPRTFDAQTLVLDDDGVGQAIHPWKAGALGRAGVEIAADYDLKLGNPVRSHFDIDVFERFGEREGNTSDLRQLGAFEAVAYPIALPGPSELSTVAILVKANGTATQGMLGVYAGGLTPNNLIAKSDQFEITPAFALLEVNLEGSVTALGKHWIAFVAGGGTFLPNAPVDGRIESFQGTILDLPSTWPTTASSISEGAAVSALLGP